MTGSPEIGPMAAVQEFIAGFNVDDIDRSQAACADETLIIDDFPPFQWTGQSAATRWYRDMTGFAAQYGMSDWSVVLDEPRHVMASEGRAYVVVPLVARWLEDGTPADRNGWFTASLAERAEQWRITAFAWAWT